MEGCYYCVGINVMQVLLYNFLSTCRSFSEDLDNVDHQAYCFSSDCWLWVASNPTTFWNQHCNVSAKPIQCMLYIVHIKYYYLVWIT